MKNKEALAKLVAELAIADMKGIVPPPVSMPLRTYVDTLRDAHKALDRIVELEAERDHCRRIVEAAQKLVEALPRCAHCDEPAIGETVRSKDYPSVREPRLCAKHLPADWSCTYGYAEPLRTLLAVLEKKP